MRPSLLLTAGFCVAVWLRMVIGGAGVAGSVVAGLAFAACLLALSWRAWRRGDVSLRVLGWGLLGAAVLFIPVSLLHMSDVTDHARPMGNYAIWAVVVSLVALAEELFLRGKLYLAILKWQGRWPAIVGGALLFAALHVPLYGWHVLPLDFTVGLWLGSLRASSGSWVAPGVAHVLADLGAWWIV